MSDKKLIRIVDVQNVRDGQHRVTFYWQDRQTTCLWQGQAPQIGDVIETTLEAPDQNPRLIGRGSADAWQADNDALRWRQPIEGSSQSRMDILRRRHIIKKAVRTYFDAQGFTEIDAPLMVTGTTPDIAVESFEIGDRYLATSTEYQMKRLAIGGLEKLYSLTQNFREGDGGAFRNPEFTMLEWGRVGEKMDAIERDAENLVTAAMHALGLGDTLSYGDQNIDMATPWERLPVIKVIERITGVAMPDFGAASCTKALTAAGVEIRQEWMAHDDFLFSLLMDHIQPQLGRSKPLFVTDWPIHQTTSAQQDADTLLAVRSELFIGGVELSDGFGGLADAGMQAQFFHFMQARRQQEGQKQVSVDQNYLQAMQLGTPYGAGMAMGFDRLVMLLTDQAHIRNVLAFAWDEV